jgi:hypothetical protein
VVGQAGGATGWSARWSAADVAQAKAAYSGAAAARSARAAAAIATASNKGKALSGPRSAYRSERKASHHASDESEQAAKAGGNMGWLG